MMDNYNSKIPLRKGFELEDTKNAVPKNAFKSLYQFSRLVGLSIILTLLLGNKSWAQVSSYTFAQSTGTYTSITGGTQIYSGSFDDGSTSFALPFTFTYNGVGYTNVMVATNGYLVFGSSDPTGGSYLNQPVISNGTAGTSVTSGAVAGWSTDVNGWTGTLGGQTSEVRGEVTGASPNRVAVFQWRTRIAYATNCLWWFRFYCWDYKR